MDQIDEVRLFGRDAHLEPLDYRYEPGDVAFLYREESGRLHFRLRSDPAIETVHLVFNEGRPSARGVNLGAENRRWRFWATHIDPDPESARLTYSFALTRQDGRFYYVGGTGQTHAVETPFALDLTTMPRLAIPAWAQGAIIYQIFPDRFANGDPTNDPPGTVPWGSPPGPHQFQGGDLQGIADHLDHLVELGVDLLYLNPVNLSPTNHKYDAIDYFQVDPAFGGDAALETLVTAAHERGLRVIVDASFNHCHPQFFAFRDLIEHGPDSIYWSWFDVWRYPVEVRFRPRLLAGRSAAEQESIKRRLARFRQDTGIQVIETEDDGPVTEPVYASWFGVINMPKIDQQNPAARAYFLEVTRYWLETFDVDGWRMDVVQHVQHNFWRAFRRAARTARPDCYLLAEVWGDSAAWLQGDQFDGTMNYSFRDLCLDYFARADASTSDFVDGLVHMLWRYAPPVMAACQNLLSSHDVPRFRQEAGDRPERLRLATLFQLTFPGAPGLYYGDEVGLSGGQDPDCRQAFPWHARDSWDQAQLDLTRSVARLRRQYPSLRHGDFQPVWQAPEALAFVRQHGPERVLVLINRRATIDRVTLPLTGRPLLLWGRGDVSETASGIEVRGLAPWSGVIVLLDPAGG